jgi:hypothetical protein
MEHMKVPSAETKEIEIAHTSKAIIKREKVMIKGVPKNIRIRKIFHTLVHLDQSVCLASPWIQLLT